MNFRVLGSGEQTIICLMLVPNHFINVEYSRFYRRCWRNVISALNVQVMRFNQAREKEGSNYDSLQAAKCLVI